MWIYWFVFAGIVINFQLVVVTCVNPTFCAFKDDNFKINTTAAWSSQNDWLRNHLEAERQQRGVFLSDGYERCEDSLNTSHCYILWARSDDPESPVVAKQGCWIHFTKDAPNECQVDKCEVPVSNWTGDMQFQFCCCTGNKCNDAKNSADSKGQDTVWPQTNTAPITENKIENKDKSKSRSTYCAYKINQPKGVRGKMTEDQGLGIVQQDGVRAKCDNDNDYCFSYYSLDPVNKSRITVSFQGCWMVHDKACDSAKCIPHEDSHYSGKRSNNSHFCCCRGNMCNNNISKDFIVISRRVTTESNGPVSRQLRDPSYKERTIVISLLSVFSLAIIILGLYLVYRFCFRPPMLPVNSNSDPENPQSPAFDIDDLKISCLIIKGRFSEVWKGSLNDQDVAVKIYSPSYRQYYYNEKYIYSLPHMEHENIMKFYGGEERILQDGEVQHLLVLQYIPDGTLMNYLKNNTIDWYTMCKMCLTLAKGIAHLHADMGSGDSFKPTVAHRDINSRNVLVKPDLSLVIADLGFCMTTMGSKLIHKGHTENAEQTSLTDVGTLRYMAPELLDGAVNLRDCEASLKQIDMYAFGLVMWEISSRCSDLYQGCPMPEFALPYQNEAGCHPSFEEMQVHVSRNKVRPKFPEVWKDYNQAIRALKETIEECWDHDAEARLTALCVEERVMEMKTIWSHDNRNKANKGVTPTINTALLSQVTSNTRPGYHGNGHTQWGGRNSNTDSSSPMVVAEGSTSALIINDIRNSTATLASQSETTSAVPQTWTNERSGSFSTSTMDTTLAVTPSESAPSHPKSQNINALMNQPVPPHQGRNPIVERNTHKRSDEELSVVGNNLFYGKDHSENEGVGNSDNIFENFTDSLESSLMQNDTLNQSRSPFVQNSRLNTGSGAERPPKVVNNPNERRENFANATAVSNIANTHVSATPKTKKAREMGILGHLALLGKLAFSGKLENKKNLNENEQATPSSMENGRLYDSAGRQNPTFEPSQGLDTEVRLTNTGTVVRPTVLQSKPCNIDKREMPETNINKDSHSNIVELDSIENNETDFQSDSPLISRHRVAPYSKSTSDLSPKKTSHYSKLEEESKMPRPSTLSLKGHNYNKSRSGSLNSLPKFRGVMAPKGGKPSLGKKPLMNGYKMIDNGAKLKSDATDKIKLRNKTPVPDKNGRYSLHDDRLMSDSNKMKKDGSEQWKSSVSLQQFKSISENESSNVYTDCTC
ncbi:bone morphogenetic protein receptor type-2-like [Mercenaria mercenaria]|uniref:bone morphogenetic protein receptor type-2-like n=1 Tax=Mercenaria mercenaria TaxID=6596 RepID=UPI00234EAC6C|nr:bone morphogenetic protein receptor type-2-like [Mercenaria mercenaria]